MKVHNTDCNTDAHTSQAANYVLGYDERIVIRSPLCSPKPPSPSAQELLSDRVRGRVRHILDHAQSDSVIVQTVVGPVMIAALAGKKYRVALLWPYKNNRNCSPHDYVLSEQTFLKAEDDRALLIDGLVSAAHKAIQDQDFKNSSIN